MRKLLFFCVILVYTGKAQTNDFSESFYFFPKNIFLLVPSYTGITSDVQGNLVYRSYFGQLSAIRAYAADFNMNLRKKTKPFPAYTKHMTGAGLYSEKEGDFINRNRIFLRYAWHIRLGKKLNLSGGTAVHAINYVFRASSAGSNGSDFAFTGNISTALYNPGFRIGISVNDFNQPSITPIDQPSIVYRYYTIHLEKILKLTSDIKITGSVRNNTVVNGYFTGLLQAGVIYEDKIGISAYAHNNQGWGVSLEIDRIDIENSLLDISFGYRLPYSKGNRVPYSAFEINLGYYLKNE